MQIMTNFYKIFFESHNGYLDSLDGD